MTSIVDLSCDTSYEEHQANIKTDWGATFIRAVYENEFITALVAILPRFSPVQIIRGEVDPSFLITGLQKRGYTVLVANT